jgi:hypothetical protein
MDGSDLERRIGSLRADAKARSRLERLWRDHPTGTAATGVDCARAARQPLRRLDPLKRRPEEVTSSSRFGFP